MAEYFTAIQGLFIPSSSSSSTLYDGLERGMREMFKSAYDRDVYNLDQHRRLTLGSTTVKVTKLNDTKSVTSMVLSFSSRLNFTPLNTGFFLRNFFPKEQEQYTKLLYAIKCVYSGDATEYRPYPGSVSDFFPGNVNLATIRQHFSTAEIIKTVLNKPDDGVISDEPVDRTYIVPLAFVTSKATDTVTLQRIFSEKQVDVYVEQLHAYFTGRMPRKWLYITGGSVSKLTSTNPLVLSHGEWTSEDIMNNNIEAFRTWLVQDRTVNNKNIYPKLSKYNFFVSRSLHFTSIIKTLKEHEQIAFTKFVFFPLMSAMIRSPFQPTGVNNVTLMQYLAKLNDMNWNDHHLEYEGLRDVKSLGLVQLNLIRSGTHTMNSDFSRLHIVYAPPTSEMLVNQVFRYPDKQIFRELHKVASCGTLEFVNRDFLDKYQQLYPGSYSQILAIQQQNNIDKTNFANETYLSRCQEFKYDYNVPPARDFNLIDAYMQEHYGQVKPKIVRFKAPVEEINVNIIPLSDKQRVIVKDQDFNVYLSTELKADQSAANFIQEGRNIVSFPSVPGSYVPDIGQVLRDDRAPANADNPQDYKYAYVAPDADNIANIIDDQFPDVQDELKKMVADNIAIKAMEAQLRQVPKPAPEIINPEIFEIKKVPKAFKRDPPQQMDIGNLPRMTVVNDADLSRKFEFPDMLEKSRYFESFSNLHLPTFLSGDPFNVIPQINECDAKNEEPLIRVGERLYLKFSWDEVEKAQRFLGTKQSEAVVALISGHIVEDVNTIVERINQYFTAGKLDARLYTFFREALEHDNTVFEYDLQNFKSFLAQWLIRHTDDIDVMGEHWSQAEEIYVLFSPFVKKLGKIYDYHPANKDWTKFEDYRISRMMGS